MSDRSDLEDLRDGSLDVQVWTNSFHEKADMSQSVFLFLFSLSSLWIPCISSRAASVAILPSALLVERFSLGVWWAFPIQ
jgi:hypothetical protein